MSKGVAGIRFGGAGSNGTVTGTGTTNRFAIWTSSTAIGDSSWEQNSNNLLPVSSNSYDIGSNTRYIKSLFINYIEYGSTLIFEQSNVQTATFKVDGNFYLTNNILTNKLYATGVDSNTFTPVTGVYDSEINCVSSSTAADAVSKLSFFNANGQYPNWIRYRGNEGIYIGLCTAITTVDEYARFRMVGSSTSGLQLGSISSSHPTTPSILSLENLAGFQFRSIRNYNLSNTSDNYLWEEHGTYTALNTSNSIFECFVYNYNQTDTRFANAYKMTATASASKLIIESKATGGVQFWISDNEKARLDTNGSFNVGVVGDTTSSAILEAKSTTKGFLPPRMTTTQRDNISSPVAGLIIYNTSTNKLNLYTTAWEVVTSA